MTGPVDGSRATPTLESVAASGAARDRRIARSAVAAFVARGSSAALSLATVPLAIGYLGAERYGVFVALTSVATMFVFGDLGIGNALINVISAANGRRDTAGARRALTAGLGLLIGVGLVFAAAAMFLAWLVPWSELVSAHSPLAVSEAAPAAAVFLLLFAVGIPLSAVERVRLAYQEAHLNSIWTIAGSALSFVGLLVGIALGVGLPTLIFLILAPTLGTTLINGLTLLRVDRPWLFPRPSEVGRSDVRELSRIGSLFLVLQLAVAIAYQSDVVVAANVLGPEAAATYSVVMRLFMFAPRLVSMALGVIWPAYTEAIVRGDVRWIRRTLKRTVSWTILTVGAVTVLLVLVHGPAITLLTQGQLKPSVGLVVGIGIWAVLSSGMNCIATLMNAATIIRFQVAIAVAMAVTSITASYLLAKLIGIEGVVAGTVGSYAIVAAVPVLLYLPRLLRGIEARAAHVG